MDRDTFLDRVRVSLKGVPAAAAPAPYQPPPPPDRKRLTDRLVREVTAVGGKVCLAHSPAEASQQIGRILDEVQARTIIRGDTALLRQLALDETLRDAGIEVTVGRLDTETTRDALRAAAFAADVGVTSVDFGVAETGSLALLARPGQGRAISLLPPIHIAVIDASNIVSELAALFSRVTERGDPPCALTFITGPSLTGDIEQKLTVGVHGPGELHLVVIE